MSENERVNQVVATISKKRNARLENTEKEVHLYIDDIMVFAAKPLEHSIKVAMLPDIFTYSTFPNEYRVGPIHFDGDGFMSVYFDLETCDIGDVFEIIQDACTDLNLYGYTQE